MKSPILYDVYRKCQGISEHKYTGTYEQCIDWVGKRRDVGVAYYSIDNPHVGKDNV